MTQRLLRLTLLSTLTLAFTACGGGGSSSGTTDTSSNTNTTTTTLDTSGRNTGNTGEDDTGNTSGGGTGNTLNTLPSCIDLNNDKGFASATDVTSKTLHKLTTAPKINVWDLNNGTKKACTVSGSVEIM